MLGADYNADAAGDGGLDSGIFFLTARLTLVDVRTNATTSGARDFHIARNGS